MIKFFLWFLPCCLVFTATGQKANSKQAERFLNLESLVGTTTIVPNSLKGTDKFWYKYETGEGVRYYFVDPGARIHREWFDRKYVAGEISRVTHKPINYKDLKISGFRLDEDGKTMRFTSEKVDFFYDLRSNQMMPVDSIKGKKKKQQQVKKNPVKSIKWIGT